MFAFTRGDGRLCAVPFSSATTIGAWIAAGPENWNAIISCRCSASPAKTFTIRTDCKRFGRRCHVEKTRRENRRPQTPAELAWRELVAEMLA